ncbi:MAG TPA: septal ring lytic transglycosylase RlpA family protein, partial [Spirochaetota bacterium]|nr:septal ring lytic transglycosylase RlpA family protein [Spirochaetota bacterium]
MKKVYILFFFFVSFVLYSERWVGHAATYQLMEGSVTSSGEVFSPQSFSAACNAFKIGAEIKILNASNGKTITVVINDRIKNNSGYFILLTPAAAKELGMEWQTGIVIVEGKFSDINSNEILDIEGLVSEREIDKELIKEFPEIKWPDETKEIDKNVKETPPQEEKDKIPDKKDIKSIDEEKIEKPKEEKTKIPEKKKNEIADNNDVSIKTKEKDKAPYDENITKIPQEKDKNISEDKEDINIPVKEKEKYPNKKEKGISEDREDINIPVKEKEKYPNKKEKGISEDREDINIPVKEKEKYPNKKEKGISDDKDDQNIPVKEKEKYPSKKEKGISDDKDDQNIPVKE